MPTVQVLLWSSYPLHRNSRLFGARPHRTFLRKRCQLFGINMQRFFGFDGLGQAGRQISNYCDCSSICFNPQRRTGVAIRLQLFGFHAHVAKLSKVLIKGRDWYVLSHCGGGD
jgi:hypothetical protein